jgi:hypothetical protein
VSGPSDKPVYLHENGHALTNYAGAAAYREPEVADQGDVDRINTERARDRRAETAEELMKEVSWLEARTRHCRKRLRKLGYSC